ncbi:MAG: hypothetical protein ACO3ZZ_07290, partial [Solirubrobacterales bacterium]
LRPSAKDISQVTEQLAPFARASNVSLTSLARATRTALPDLQASIPIVELLGEQARAAKEPSTSLDFFLKSTREADGFKNLMRFFYNTGSALSGYDQFGHYQRTNVIITGCTEYKLGRFSNCPSQWDFTRSSLRETARDVLPELDSGGIGADQPVGPLAPEEPDQEEVEPEVEPESAPEDARADGAEAGAASEDETTQTVRKGKARRKGDPRQATEMAILEYLLGR